MSSLNKRFADAPPPEEIPAHQLGLKSPYEYCEMASAVLAGAAGREAAPRENALMLRTLQSRSPQKKLLPRSFQGLRRGGRRRGRFGRVSQAPLLVGRQGAIRHRVKLAIGSGVPPLHRNRHLRGLAGVRRGASRCMGCRRWRQRFH